MSQSERERVLECAARWLNTPYHHMGRVRGAGVDCAMLPLEIYTEAGLIRYSPVVPFYPLDWAMHRDEERYLNMVREIVARSGGAEVAHPSERRPMPGEFLLFQFGRAFSHGAVVVEWPLCMHAHIRRGVEYVDVLAEPKLRAKIDAGQVMVFRLFEEDPNVRRQ
jgi:cell wall-associated NlpC family hydrolase